MVTSNALPKTVCLTNDSDIGDGKSDEIQFVPETRRREGSDTSVNHINHRRWKDMWRDLGVRWLVASDVRFLAEFSKASTKRCLRCTVVRGTDMPST